MSKQTKTMENGREKQDARKSARPVDPFLDVLLLSFEIWVFIFVPYCALTFADFDGARCHAFVKSGINSSLCEPLRPLRLCVDPGFQNFPIGIPRRVPS